MNEKEANLSKNFMDQITPKNPFKKNKIKGVKKIIAISSGKGGVGKSTIAVNLAIALKNLKYNVGILDADIYGPSIPKMIGILEKPKSEDGINLIPIKKFNLQCMSIGFMVSEETPMIWRGPMVASTIKTFANKVLWDNVDFLIIDMPPGTGDALLTFSQEIDIDGAVIITTPQDIAIIDVKRGIEMFKRTNVKILGIIENMTSFTSNDGVEHFIFGKDGAKNIADKFNIELLGQIPINIDLRKGSDEGLPFVEFNTENKVSNILKNISEKIIKNIN
ncbi:MAG: ATP-binding protein [Candidatus Fonsibacter lacus]|jgi:ATP-binding protein involved in chromosome partitioning|uniref:Iron-sulfur cluster carrier protein n=1 Tax=Candidatus Fonsibacter lacus TaxID=2576439 RepID=A0A845S9H1_9PROT|nr:ATP-binding protein [Candidatus Fonsibacter lacus]NBP59803.1 ATP-binding protein [Pseudomonadota bacterium]NBY89231.1 ATP-binding protein [Candidatus Fonsibacter lacus]NCU50600.1 ATP-binding protein [Candidatus Fonsibacter lacus]NCU53310.1 ATP-binding protein [Candidatus Fonsibacter lacus]